jgi:uncharacterized protein (TIGR03437 family)
MCLLWGLRLLGASGLAIGEIAIDPQGYGSIDVTLTLEHSITALQFDIQYQDTAFGLAVTAASAIRGKNLWTSSPQPDVTRVLVAGLNATPISNGVVATIAVEVKAGTPPGRYPIMIGKAITSDHRGYAVYLPANEGAVTITGPAIMAIANAASYTTGTVAPGEIVVLGGRSLGATGVHTLQVDSTGQVATSLAGTRVLFDGIAAPLVYSTPNQVSAVVPYAVDGQPQTVVEVEFQGIRSAPLVLPVTRTSPGIFTLDGSGKGQGAIVNEDGTINGPDNPAARGSVVSVFGTGEGQTIPGGADGTIAGAEDLRRPVAAVAASIGDQSAEILYAGSAGGQVAGLLQINLRVPLSVTSGEAVLLTITIGSTSQAGVTMAVK